MVFLIFFCLFTKIFDTIQNNGYNGQCDKVAKLSAIDFVNRTFILFKGNKQIKCDSSDKKDIDHIQYMLSEYLLILFCLQKRKMSKH